MAKEKQHFLHNKTFGHIVAAMFYIILGYSLFLAASNMNYIWKWSGVPKYFMYEKTDTITSPIDGNVRINGTKIIIEGIEDSKEIEIEKGYTLQIAEGDHIYENDPLAYQTSMQMGPLVEGLLVTLEISGLAAILAFSMGALLAFMRISHYQFLKDIATIYIAIIRGTPLLVQIFIFYFIIATIFEIERFFAGAISLGLFFGAYIAEVLRGAIQSIDKGQYEAAKSLGMNYPQTMLYIIMPQALKRALPTLVGEMIALVKDSSLVSVISITDLTKVGREIVANTFSPFETWLIIAAVYFMITFLLTAFGHKIETKMKKQGGM
ncbi:amino acid ABC transporter permease [Sulfurospirillum deleyianum]|uniref:Putative glutamine transport system permease protein GlnP n=1 Tax=Sulfurospirillum deleyianum (strain ATCC 51133 / DSM 6946 / 5175) TaxID=525898 RepID=D1AZ23_SULD5|nr:amino acid ABC transporter permease [Sulfurospirillum deleyianum]ACZ11161.1 polar amino acid ABC transporter, inner membrane subunit [Sulfurospirillum deleyianum DSM 6946]